LRDRRGGKALDGERRPGVLVVVLDDGETYGSLDGCVILDVDSAGLRKLENGQAVGRLVEAGLARVVANFVNDQRHIED
jgi:hypothetical protein